MVKKILFFLSIISFFASCSNETDVVLNSLGRAGYFVSQDSAIVLANQAVASLSESLRKKETRCSSARVVKSVDVVYPNVSPFTRTNAKNDISDYLYIVNYEKSRGFAVVASDRRLKPIYALSDSGNLNVKDTLLNKGLACFFKGVDDEIQTLAASSSPMAIDLDGEKFVVGAQVTPLLLSGTRKWGQDAPYNEYCFAKDGNKAVVGCPAVAMGQILSYYNWPQKIGTTKLQWRSMTRNANNSNVAKLFAFLGSEDILAMDYGVKSSGADPNLFPAAFAKMGYERPKFLQSFSEKKYVIF